MSTFQEFSLEDDALHAAREFSLEAEKYESHGVLKEIMNRHGAHLKFDRRLANEIKLYIQNFVNKNPDHINALGSNMLGVYQMRFMPSDRAEWEENLLGIDALALKREINQIPYMKVAGVRASDTFNNTCVWLCYRWYISDLPDNLKHDAMKDTMVILQYKFFSSLLQHYFQFSLDPNVAAAVYSEFSRKFDIKRLGTWKDVIDHRAENIVSPGEVHHDAIRFYDDDIKIVKMIQDIQYRLRDKFKNVWEVLALVLEQDKKFGTTSHSIELDGVITTRDLQRVIPEYKRYIHEVSVEAARFLKPPLMQVIEDAMPTMPAKPFEQLLFMFHERCAKKDAKATRFIDLVLEHLFNVFLEDRDQHVNLRDTAEVIIAVRGLYTSSRTVNDLVLEMRDLGEWLAKKDLKMINKANLSALRTGLMLYVVLRTITKNHYS